MDPLPRDHLAARIEDRAHGVVEQGLRRVGWVASLEPQTGYGLAGAWVRVMARVVLRPPDRGIVAVVRARSTRGWQRFVTQAASSVVVTLRVGEVEVAVLTNREGYVDERVAVDLAAGWHSARLSVEGGEEVEAPLRVVAGDAGLGLVSDIDDTVVVTNLPRPLLALRNAFWLRESDRRPVRGMAALYADVLRAHPEAFVIYLSTGAWNVAPALRAFLERHGYPAGPLLLTDWGPSQRGWFRSGQEHKRTELARLVEELPDLDWLLVGDDGQHDPSLYAEVVASCADRVRAVVIRELSASEQVATHGTPGSPDDTEAATLRTEAMAQVPWVQAPDGEALAVGLRERGLLP